MVWEYIQENKEEGKRDHWLCFAEQYTENLSYLVIFKKLKYAV